MSDGQTAFLALICFAMLVIGGFVGAAFVAPEQAEARAQINRMKYGEVESPTLEATCQGALTSTRALAERLEGVTEQTWGIDE